MEYGNINIFQINSSNPTSNKIEQIVDGYRKKGNMPPVTIDNDYNILSGEEIYWAGKKMGLPYLLAQRAHPAEADPISFPSRLLVEVTNDCNSFCKMCPRKYLTREKKHMEPALFKKVIDEISKYPCDGLWLYNIGESLLHPDFFNLLDYVQNYPGIRPLWLSTNGMLITEKVSERILGSKLDYLNFSLNALDEETHKKISPMLDFQTIVTNLNNLIRMKMDRKQRKPFVRVQMIDQPVAHHQIEQFKGEWGPKADIISINILEEFSKPSLAGTKRKMVDKKKYKCTRMDKGFIYIYSNGEVTLCGVDINGDMRIGNVKNTSIKELWDSDKRHEMIKNILNGNVEDYPICQGCLDSQLLAEKIVLDNTT